VWFNTFQVLKYNGVDGLNLKAEDRDRFCKELLADNAYEHGYTPEERLC
jgi:hypothetical protein